VSPQWLHASVSFPTIYEEEDIYLPFHQDRIHVLAAYCAISVSA